MSDDDLMMWGIHVGKKMSDVPASYLIYMYENNKCDLRVKQYVIENLQALRKEIQDVKNTEQNNRFK